MPKVLVVATSRRTRGGITSVIKAHEKGEQWQRFHCHWVQTHRDGNSLVKIAYLIGGYLDFILRIPFYDIVHFHISQPTTVKRKSPLLKLAKLIRKKIVTHFHAFNTEDTIEGSDKLQYKLFFENSDKIIVLSNWWKEQLKKHLSLQENKIVVLYNPCPDVTRFPSTKTNSILYAGTIYNRKGYADLIKAFAKIAGDNLDWKVVFAGNGEIEKGKSLARDLGIERQVEFVGWVTGEEKNRLFSETSIFCLPSYAEGFPMAVLDAWAYGLPVITTPVGGIPDIAIDGENMLLFNPGDVDMLAKLLGKMIADSSLREQISEASINFATNEFSIRTINHQLAVFYNNLP